MRRLDAHGRAAEGILLDGCNVKLWCLRRGHCGKDDEGADCRLHTRVYHLLFSRDQGHEVLWLILRAFVAEPEGTCLSRDGNS